MRLLSPICSMLTICSSVMVFVGTILLQGETLPIVAGSIVGFIGIGYCALQFIPSIEPPENMREAGGEWGAEQI